MNDIKNYHRQRLDEAIQTAIDTHSVNIKIILLPGENYHTLSPLYNDLAAGYSLKNERLVRKQGTPPLLDYIAFTFKTKVQKKTKDDIYRVSKDLIEVMYLIWWLILLFLVCFGMSGDIVIKNIVGWILVLGLLCLYYQYTRIVLRVINSLEKESKDDDLC